MNRIIGDMQRCAVYLDDVVVYLDTWETHLEHIRELFTHLAELRLTVNLAKCEFVGATLAYLGRVIGQGQVCPVSAKIVSSSNNVEGADAVSLPRGTGHQFVLWKSVICLVSIKSKSIQTSQTLLSSAPVLAAPGFDRPFQLSVGASYVGAGSVLMQEDDLGIDKCVSFFSHAN